MQPVQVRGLTLGGGEPAICVPASGRSAAEVLDAVHLVHEAGPDLIEWRADGFEALNDVAAVLNLLREVRAAAGEVPLLFTVRTKREGGRANLTQQAYLALGRAVAASGFADLLDIELDTGEAVVRELVAAAKENGVAAVLSNHDFEKTPPEAELLSRLRQMEALGADIAKIAVMPSVPGDVLALLGATNSAVQGGIRCPLITMAMGWLGSISRVSGAFFGSCVTFGAAVGASAPGQLPIEQLRTVLDILKPPHN